MGSSLFIPFFFINIGLLVDFPVFVETLATELGLAAAVVVVLVGSKFLGALAVARCFRYSWNDMAVMGSLSLPQVAATLAAALAGLETGVLSEELFNAVIVLMLVTALLGPLLTERFASKMPPPKASVPPDGEPLGEAISTERERAADRPFTVVVPLSDAGQKADLLATAALLAQHESGQLVPLAIVPSRARMDDPSSRPPLPRPNGTWVRLALWRASCPFPPSATCASIATRPMASAARRGSTTPI